MKIDINEQRLNKIAFSIFQDIIMSHAMRGKTPDNEGEHQDMIDLCMAGILGVVPHREIIILERVQRRKELSTKLIQLEKVTPRTFSVTYGAIQRETPKEMDQLLDAIHAIDNEQNQEALELSPFFPWHFVKRDPTLARISESMRELEEQKRQHWRFTKGDLSQRDVEQQLFEVREQEIQRMKEMLPVAKERKERLAAQRSAGLPIFDPGFDEALVAPPDLIVDKLSKIELLEEQDIEILHIDPVLSDYPSHTQVNAEFHLSTWNGYFAVLYYSTEGDDWGFKPEYPARRYTVVLLVSEFFNVIPLSIHDHIFRDRGTPWMNYVGGSGNLKKLAHNVVQYWFYPNEKHGYGNSLTFNKLGQGKIVWVKIPFKDMFDKEKKEYARYLEEKQGYKEVDSGDLTIAQGKLLLKYGTLEEMERQLGDKFTYDDSHKLDIYLERIHSEGEPQGLIFLDKKRNIKNILHKKDV